MKHDGFRAGIAAVTPVKDDAEACAGVKANSPAARTIKNILINTSYNFLRGTIVLTP